MDARSDLPVADRPSSPPATAAGRLPPPLYFVASAVFHYLGPAFAVLLFARVEPLGVAWLRIASAALIFAAWRRPWRRVSQLNAATRWNIAGLGVVLGGMNACFYLAIDRLPLATVGAIEFLGPIGLALAGLRTQRNIVALALVVAGVWLLTRLRLAGTPLGFVFAFANCALFTLYIVLGHRVANDGGGNAIDRLAAAMLVALVVVTLIGIRPAAPALLSLPLLAAGTGVGVTSSVIPYVCDQLAMARLPRATFATLLALLPATACMVGAVVLHQLPGRTETIGIALVAAGIAIHHEARQ
ncbi:EamA family transporter [Rhodanobacter sp. C06]|uniref:EamA family transporter n=1 Tax=Rhodanobacter sp. C06 TaxID=1945854 RepID=UPI00098579DA|nr:EamA family transporter [Rhodanobacter sp. C06]OOG44852.1 EamA family transporter [Rhodanobacter sp. C06]